MIKRYGRDKMTKIWSAKNKFQKWLDVELAVCEAQHKLGVIPEKALNKIKEKAGFTLKDILKKEKETHHEVVAFLSVLQKRIGKDGRFLHLGLTSSDIMDTATSLQLMESFEILYDDVKKLLAVLKRQAIKYKYNPIIGRTHGMHAEPTTFGLKLAVFYSEFERHQKRLEELKPRIGVGKISGAVGNFAQLDPKAEESAMKKLGLDIVPVSTQILQRDRHAEFVFVCSLIAASCEKVALEIRNLQRTEVGEVEEPFAAKQKGSSAMPHKRNPVKSEQICGLARIVRAAVIPALENISLWHERDISHSSAERVILPDTCIALDYILNLLTTILDGLVVNIKEMEKNIDMTRGLVFSQRFMLRLIAAGMERDRAHTMVQGKAMAVVKKNKNFHDEVIKDGEIRRFLSLEEIEAMFDLDIYLRHVDTIFKRVFGQ